MRLIDSEKLIEYCNNQKVKTIDANDIARFPTVDAAPVIRCKDCINWDTDWTTHPPEHYCPPIDQFTSADFYCGYAEKKDLEEQDAKEKN